MEYIGSGATWMRRGVDNVTKSLKVQYLSRFIHNAPALRYCSPDHDYEPPMRIYCTPKIRFIKP